MNINNNNMRIMSNIDTRLLFADYVRHRLNREGLSWSSCPELPTPSRVQLSMRVLGDEFEHRYCEVFQEMCNQLHITPNTAHATFVGIVNELFSDGIKWGRIVALFSFGGALAVQCAKGGGEMPLLVDNIVDWVTQYVDTSLASWINQHGSWDGFVDFYDKKPENRQESPWPSLSTICGYAAGALGVLTLGAILSQKS